MANSLHDMEIVLGIIKQYKKGITRLDLALKCNISHTRMILALHGLTLAGKIEQEPVRIKSKEGQSVTTKLLKAKG